MYHKILVPLENSPADDAIIEHVEALGREQQAQLILIHVADGFGARYQEGLDLADSEEMKQDRAYLERRRDQLAGAGLDVEAVLETGEPAARIAEVAESRQCDLIAMATHRHRALADLVLGSVAAAVRHKTQIPVLLVPAR